MRERGTTMLELVTLLAVLGILAAVAVPGAAKARHTVSAAQAAQRLALVLRTAQAEAQSLSTSVRVRVDGDGEYSVRRETGVEVMSGSLGARVTSTYPGGGLVYSARGWASLPGASSPRAGHFDFSGTSHTVVVQLSGCVRCT